MKSKTTLILWMVYICLLLVLVPHTAWAFEKMEMPGTRFTHWAAAIAFEAAIAVLTHKLAKHIESTGKIKGRLNKFAARYLNPIALGLLFATLVSALANLAHAVEFGQQLKIFTEWGIKPKVYSLAFGGVLPVVSLIFARVLSNVVDDEDAPNPELEAAKGTIADLRKQARETEARVKAQIQENQLQVKATEEAVRRAEERARLANERFDAIGDLVKYLFGEDKRQRIVTAHRQWPQLPGSAIAIISGSSPAYVSEVLKEAEIVDV